MGLIWNKTQTFKSKVVAARNLVTEIKSNSKTWWLKM